MRLGSRSVAATSARFLVVWVYYERCGGLQRIAAPCDRRGMQQQVLAVDLRTRVLCDPRDERTGNPRRCHAEASATTAASQQQQGFKTTLASLVVFYDGKPDHMEPVA